MLVGVLCICICTLLQRSRTLVPHRGCVLFVILITHFAPVCCLLSVILSGLDTLLVISEAFPLRQCWTTFNEYSFLCFLYVQSEIWKVMLQSQFEQFYSFSVATNFNSRLLLLPLMLIAVIFWLGFLFSFWDWMLVSADNQINCNFRWHRTVHLQSTQYQQVI